jgi:hypothetical protein
MRKKKASGGMKLIFFVLAYLNVPNLLRKKGFSVSGP